MKKTVGILVGILTAVTVLCFVLIPQGSVSASESSVNGFEIKNGILASYTGTERSITIPSGVTEIGPEAFYNSKIETITIPGNVKRIGNRAFYGSKKLYRVIIQDGVQEIGMSAFSFCTDLDKAVLPASVKKIEAGAFSYCSALETLELSPDNRSFFYNDGVLYNHNSTELIQYLAGRKAQSYKMPFSIKEVEPYAFWGASHLTDVDISNNVKVIGPYTFANCIGLESIYLPESVTEVREKAFYGCTNLSYVGTELASVKIGDDAFKDCSEDLKTEGGVARSSFTPAKTSDPDGQETSSAAGGVSASGSVKVVDTIPKSSVPGTEDIPEVNMTSPSGLIGATKIVNGNALVILSENKAKPETPADK